MTKKYKIKTHKATAKRLFARMLEVTNSADRRKIKRLAPYLSRHKANPPRG